MSEYRQITFIELRGNFRLVLEGLLPTSPAQFAALSAICDLVKSALEAPHPFWKDYIEEEPEAPPAAQVEADNA